MKVYPSWRYHRELGSKLIQDEAEEQSLGHGWLDTPAKFKEAQESEEIEESIPKRRGRKSLAQDSEGIK